MINEIGGLLVHESANFFPMLSRMELEALALDIKLNGLKDPIILFKKNGVDCIIDGRNRAMACHNIGVVPEYKYYENDESTIFEYVLSTNLHRRHLSNSQRACLAVNILPMIEEKKKNDLSKKISMIRSGETVEKAKRSNEIAAEMFSIGAANVTNAKRVKNHSIELFNRILSGELNVAQGLKLMKNTEDVIEIAQPHIAKSVKSPEDVTQISHPQTVKSVELSEDVIEIAQPETSTLTKADSRKVDELKGLGVSEPKAIEYILSKRKPKAIAKPKTSFSNRIEFKVDESEKSELMAAAKERGMSLSEYIRSLIKKG